MIILFGAGASFGSDDSGTPPLVEHLFEDLRVFNPNGWGSIDNDLLEQFREDFEVGMVQLSRDHPHSLPPLQRAMAAYFYRFTPGPQSLYIRLANRLRAARWEGALCSLNYERLLELSLGIARLRPVIGTQTDPGRSIELCLPHGCCHLFCESTRGDSRVVSFAGMNVKTDSPVIAISDPTDFHARIQSDAFPPVMSYFEPHKETTSGATFISRQRSRWSELVSQSKIVVLIGIKVRPHDEHIWNPLAYTEARIVYCSGESSAREFEDWSSEVRANRKNIVLRGYFADEFDVLCQHIGV